MTKGPNPDFAAVQEAAIATLTDHFNAENSIEAPTAHNQAEVAGGDAGRGWLYRATVGKMMEHPAATLATAVGFIGGPATGIALASTGSTAPAAVTAPGTTTTVKIVSRGVNANAKDVARKKIIVGEDSTVKFNKKDINDDNCITTKPGQPWTNSVILANGKEYKYTETVSATLCRDKNASMGWVKVAGGKTGKPCYNDANPRITPDAHKDVEVINIKDLKTSFKLVAKVVLDKSVECPGVTGHGKVTGKVVQRFKYSDYLKMKGNAQTKIDFSLIDRASVKAHLDLDCTSTEVTTTTTTPGETPTPTTTPTTTPTATPTPVGAQETQSINNVQEVDESTAAGTATTPIVDTVEFATPGDKYLTCFKADYGKFVQNCIEQVATGRTFTATVTYQAPTEPHNETVYAATLNETENRFANPDPATEGFPIVDGYPAGGQPKAAPTVEATPAE